MDDEELRRYLEEAARQPLLSAQREKNLLLSATGGDAGARTSLVRAYLRLVASTAHRYEGRGLSLPDLVEAGHAGLERAVDKFDSTKGFKFSTFATWWIRQAITRRLADGSRSGASG